MSFKPLSLRCYLLSTFWSVSDGLDILLTVTFLLFLVEDILRQSWALQLLRAIEYQK